MLVTMFTDASLIDATRSGGWAVWAKSERGTLKHQGPLIGETMSSGEAELKAIVNGLHCLTKSEILVPHDTLLVQADSYHALHCLRRSGKRPLMTLDMKKALGMFFDLVDSHSLEYRTKHVKAHSGVGVPRLWVHNDCDRRARACARQLHAQRGKGWYHAEQQELQA